MSCLRRSAEAAIARIAIIIANYEGEIEMLKRRFEVRCFEFFSAIDAVNICDLKLEDKKLVKSALYQQLNDIRCAGPKLTNIRTTVEMIDKVCNQLSAHGEDVNHPGIAIQLEKKFSPDIRLKLGEAKLVFPEWTVKIMRKKLHELIQLRERAYEDNECRNYQQQISLGS